MKCANKSSQEYKDLLTKFNGDDDLAQAFWDKIEDSIDVQKSNIASLDSGSKTVSVRNPNEHNYNVGDNLKVKVKGLDTKTRVKIESITRVDDFTKISDKRKDDFAKAMGNYSSFEDFTKNNSYAKENSSFTDLYDFISGKVAGDIIKYSKTDELAIGETKESNELINIVNKVKLFLEKKLAIIEKKKIFNQAKKKKDIQDIMKQLESLDEISTINTFIEDAYDKTIAAQILLDELINKKDKYTRHEIISRLATFNEFVNGYSILDTISKEDIKELEGTKKRGISESADFSIRAKLVAAIKGKSELKEDYINIGIPLLADYLLESKSTKLTEDVLSRIKHEENKIKVAQNSKLLSDKAKERKIKEAQDTIKKLKPYDIDKESLIKELKLASKDEGALDYLISPLISSDDSVLALFAKSIKSTLEGARLKDLESQKNFSREFNLFEKSNTKSKDVVSKFNEDLIEEFDQYAGKDENGESKFIKVKSFVRKYDQVRFEKAKSDFYKKLGKKPTEEGLSLKQYKKEEALWFKNNTEEKPQGEIDRIIKDKRHQATQGLITPKEYEDWYASVTYIYKDKISYRRELTNPASHYITTKWNNMYDGFDRPINNTGEYHAFLVDIYLKDQEKLPESARKEYILPSIPKSDLERIQTQGTLSTIKRGFNEAVNITAYDNQFGIATVDEAEAKFLPTYFTQQMEANDVSDDLISSIMKFHSMSNRYEALNEINGEISLMKSVIGEREVVKTTSKGEMVIDAFASKFGYNEFIRKNGEAYSTKHINDFIDMVVYGEMQAREEIFGKDAGKITNSALKYSAVTTLAVDLLKATANNIQGNIQLTIEANSGENFSKKDLLKGGAFYIKSVPEMLKDFGKISPDSLASQLNDLYDGIQGTFKDKFGKNISGSNFNKLFRTDTLFFNQHFAEHEIQVKALFAILEANKVIDNESNSVISLLDAYKKYGININDKTNFTEVKRFEIMNTHHAIAKRLHGVYNEFDKGTVQRYAIGRLTLMYRKYLVPAYKRRWKRLSGDQEYGGITEGYYITFWKTFGRDMRDLQFNIFKNWEGYSDQEKAQIKRVAAEASFIIALTTLAMVLKNAGDDDKDLKKNYVYNFILYQAVRNRSETFSYLNPQDAYRTVKSPSAMTTTVDRSIKLIDQLIFTWDSEKLTYQKKTGVALKGDNKSWVLFKKFAGFSSYNFSPEEAVKSFEGTLSK